MNRENIYATSGTIGVGFNTTSEYSIEYTATANTLSWDGDMSAYALGYINPDQLPNVLAISEVFITDEEDVDERKIVIQRVSPTNNAQIGYGLMSSVYAAYHRTDEREGEATSTTVGSLSDLRFCNNLYPEFIATKSTVSLYMRWYVVINGAINEISETVAVSFDGDTSFYSWEKFKNGSKITRNFTISGVDYGNIEYGYNDFDHGRYSGTTSSGTEVTGYFVGFQFPAQSYKSGASAGNVNYNFLPLINYSGTYSYGDISGSVEQTYCRNKTNNNSVNSGIALYQFDYNSGEGRLTNINDYYGYGDDVIDVGMLRSVFYGSPKPPIHTHIYTDNTLIEKESNNNQVTLFPIRDFDEVDQFFALYSRFTAISSPPVSYRENMTYCCDVDENNKFSIHYKTGNIDDESFKNSLRPWQYIDRANPDDEDNGTLNTNDFDPTDPDQMPPYEPEPPEPTPGTDIPDDENPEPLNPGEKGDEGNVVKNTSVPNAISAFTTSYIMTELEVSSFGNRLWTSVQNEPSAQKNFFTISNDEADYELTNSNIIDYLVSLKWYPFSITQYCNFSTWSAYLIGSGTYAYTGSAYVAEDAVGYIPGGSVNIPWSTNTFVDLEPYTSVSFYIPFCGTVDIPASKVRGRRVTLDYYVDYITGGCTAYLTVPTANGSFPVASINGTLGFDMLVTGNNAQVIAARAYQQNNERRLREIEGLGGAIVDALGGLVSSSQGGGGSKSGSSRDFGSVGGITSIAKSIGSAAFSEIQGKLSQGTIQGTSPLTLGSASTLSGLGYIKPFAAVTSRVFFNNGLGYDKVGYISNKPLTISSIKDGIFFNCINPELKNVGATNSELAQITSMLSSGVYK